MHLKSIAKKIQCGNNQEIIIETGKLARQAEGAVMVKVGTMMLLATVVTKKGFEESLDFLPLYVDYQEKFSAAGKIPGGFLKREGRLGDHEILVSRLVDRAIRPLFPERFTDEVQVNIALISVDESVLPDAFAALAASTALMLSSVPFQGPISEVRVARVGQQILINPTPKEVEKADINLMVGATAKHILMVEGAMQEVQEADLIEAIQVAHEAIKQHCAVQQELVAAVGIVEKSSTKEAETDLAFKEMLHKALYDPFYAVAQKAIQDKKSRKEAFQAIKQQYIKSLAPGQEFDSALVDKYGSEIEKKVIRDLIFNQSMRVDGRKLDEIRPIYAEVDYLPAAHGSALFTRGETQALTTVTLGSKMDEQIIDQAMVNGYSKFMLHYNFPGFATGEVKPNRGPSRREIGHGHLAMRALKAVLPTEEENPYTIRIVSDILESNGSSSMATVCAGSLALMDTGIAIKSHVSGIAMGLIIDHTTGRYAILSDIVGYEDHVGDMDFKVAGTQAGITACQLDSKVVGLSYQMLTEALTQAKAGRLQIMEAMQKTLNTPRQTLKSHIPRIKTLTIAQGMIGAVIGPAGKVVQEIQRRTGTTIVIDEAEGVGLVRLFAPNQESIEKAEKSIQAIVAKPVVGEVYAGKVKSIVAFGAFVEFMPGKEGLLHISQIAWERVDQVENFLEIGEELAVKLLEIDPKTGKYKLSRKVLLSKSDTPTGG